MPDFAVILPAAGRSTRFGGSTSKLLQPLAARPVLAWTLDAFAARDDVRQIVIAANAPDAIRDCAKGLEKSVLAKLKICPGGSCRADSVRLAALACDAAIDWIAVHDAARPLVSQALIDRTFQVALAHGAAAAALPVHLTIKKAAGPLPAQVKQTIPRHDLWAMQTPQAMRRQDLLDAFAACPIPLDQVTDDVQLLELAGKPVWLVEGEERNLKITTPVDLQIADTLLRGLPT
ncbi:MAG TPA: 2-C-methyl-D-erythritol 4-phosphate cytidylyltransferase [Tepidisphaeraceae bacterium]|jgi:2-C-methyl-D-erythritol 4-phosphate cytidylyltransferase|nr:2-C-methyl-D-erythritol 4-phosphate cytidylyltransferase [Tepidisphaeraceae bacterium]